MEYKYYKRNLVSEFAIKLIKLNMRAKPTMEYKRNTINLANELVIKLEKRIKLTEYKCYKINSLIDILIQSYF